jgi:hypothetical protein
MKHIIMYKNEQLASMMLKYSPLFLMITGGAYMFYAIYSKDVFGIKGEDEDVTDEDITTQELRRGTVVSIMSAFLLNFVGALMKKSGVPDGYIILNYGFILGPVLGYMFDIMLATEKGFQTSKENPTKGFVYALQNLWNKKFFKYVVTVLLDMFISNPLQDAMKLSLEPIMKGITNNKLHIGQLVKENFASFLQSVVGLITFQAYTNDTRFLWAYLDKEPEHGVNTISNSTMMLALSISGVLFATYDLSNAESINTRLPYVLFAILYISILNQGGYFDLEDEVVQPDGGIDFDERAQIGLVIFICVLLFGLGIPMMNMNKI